MRIGVQLYGIGHGLISDRSERYRKIAGMGYREIEPCVMFTEGFPFQDTGLMRPEELLGDLQEIKGSGIELHSVHAYSFDFEKDTDRMCALAAKAGIGSYVLKPPVLSTETDAADYVDRLSRLAEKLREGNVRLLLHNEPADTLTRFGEKTVLGWLMDRLRGTVFLQADVGNLLAGGEDPVRFLWENKDMIASVHFKDLKRTEKGLVETALGDGDLDVVACYQFARAMGASKIVDMDNGTEDAYQKSAALLADMSQRRDNSRSLLWSVDTDTGEMKLLHRFDTVIEAPNWLKDGDTILFNMDGGIYRYSIAGDAAVKMDTGKCVNCNNDHVPSPDNRCLAVSHSDDGIASQIYIVGMETGRPRQVTTEPYSFLHGWSPDGKTLAYCGIRFTPEGMKTDVYTIPVDGGEEKRLTDSDGYSDGCEYAPDGTIWYNSTASGLMQVYKMNPDGSEKVQMTDSAANNWFPHVSPDNSRVVYLTFKKGELDPNEHLPNMFVSLNLMDTDGKNKRKLIDFFGGQGSINVNSWAPDSRRLAIVTYELDHQ